MNTISLTTSPSARWKTGTVFFFLLIVAASASLVFATEDQDREVIRVASPSSAPPDATPETEEPALPFARVRYQEGGLKVTRQDGYDEDLRTNDPVYVGDVVFTPNNKRAEIQLPDGSLVRLDQGSEIEIFDLGGDGRRPDRPSVIAVKKGSIQFDAGDEQSLRVDTPAASVYPLETSAFRVDSGPGGPVRVTVEQGRVEVAGEENSVEVLTGQRTQVQVGQNPRAAWRVNLYTRDEFDNWVAQRDDTFRLRSPKNEAYRQLPSEIRPYYNELSNYGSWVYTDTYGWVWSPDNLDSDWRPYYDGYWSPGPWGSVWVGSEPWGWVVYRYGRWTFHGGLGWIWAPGRYFAPAHVYWYYGPEYLGWCPLDYWDRPAWFSFNFGWGNPWFDHHCWNFYPYHDFYHHHGRPRDVIRPHLNDGVVSRRAIIPPRERGRDTTTTARGAHRPIPRVVDPGTYGRARDLAREKTRTAKENPETAMNPPKTGFREAERPAIERRKVIVREAGTPQAGGLDRPVVREPRFRSKLGNGRDNEKARPSTDGESKGSPGREKGTATPKQPSAPERQPAPRPSNPSPGGEKGGDKGSGKGRKSPITNDDLRPIIRIRPVETDQPLGSTPPRENPSSASPGQDTERQPATRFPRRASPTEGSDSPSGRSFTPPSSPGDQNGGDTSMRRFMQRLSGAPGTPQTGNGDDNSPPPAAGFPRRVPSSGNSSGDDQGSAGRPRNPSSRDSADRPAPPSRRPPETQPPPERPAKPEGPERPQVKPESPSRPEAPSTRPPSSDRPHPSHGDGGGSGGGHKPKSRDN